MFKELLLKNNISELINPRYKKGIGVSSLFPVPRSGGRSS
jgi:hypothetical protein